MFQTELDLAVLAAKRGGEVLRRGLGTIRDVRTVGYKGEIDLVTEFDHASEQAIVQTIRERHPDHTIYAEEGTTGGSDTQHRWIIDPLDGTTNFAHGYPMSCVSIAYECGGQLAAATVYDPFRDELFVATAGGGATLNGKPLRVSTTPDLAHALIATGFPYDRSLLDPVLERWNRMVRQAQAVRRDGAAALNLAYLAAGRFDGFYEATLQTWDAAAGVLIIREAGGKVTDYFGKLWSTADHSVIAANSAELHRQLLEILA